MSISALWNNQVKFLVGDTVRINYRIVEEGKKERTQAYEGLVIKIRGRGSSMMFTVRKLAVDKVAVERVFPLNSPWIQNVEIIKHSKKRIRRSKLYYLRDK